MKTFAEVIEYLYARLPMFTRDGASAINPDVDNTLLLCEALGNPQQQFKSVHIAGTNGKGSTSHMMASVFQASGLKTGLYTSPHLVDFRERIRIDGQMIPQKNVIDFINANQTLIETIKPSFFEVTVALAFDFFAKNKVDIAVIEVGLGGRLDSTNIIQPELSMITNIGMDHMNVLGNTLEEIAGEKAGIIKEGTPVVISERQAAIQHVFQDKAAALNASLYFANDYYQVEAVNRKTDGLYIDILNNVKQVSTVWHLDLAGGYQQKNILGVLYAIDKLRELGFNLPHEKVVYGLSHVQESTGLRGRWQTLSDHPWIICDTGHNEDGIREVLANLASLSYDKLHFIFGAMRDKDLSHILPQLPKDAVYYFAAPEMPRAMLADQLRELAATFGLKGNDYNSISDAFLSAKEQVKDNELIFIGGSTFVVADVLTNHF
ncbi:bifunctional folylpolyglutamate synthase/dihydrofolate synthase [Sphingobacterium sp. DK4209]|uniref:Dihydrofolate synthase/folylpolyglutamate synthase n=1 Tax=Sphingobacterium zhuxiongii TaxID=2662364 RepID=A0A5Q0Q803_9SPHI|nr:MULTISPECIES: folylpolyglutamate synthase/dihydrofolate synthase family protein [unclassified Sphingobacterium]MVZ67190.1 bifunctional folylpolyglutamate synthase/dihydrofolate synthase [Sphingobacterium sp. DK4209]QGA25496.1 bifunctional folylpolyglutamate synthase/dihydrofolate synthase [Sphingobacterium sp. dk4302]